MKNRRGYTSEAGTTFALIYDISSLYGK